MHKTFFKEPPASVANDLDITTIVPEDSPREDIRSFRYLGLIDRILNLNEGECIVLEGNLLPSTFANGWQFLKHGIKVIPSEEQAIRAFIKRHFTPMDLRIESFNNLEPNFVYSGYEYFPFNLKPYTHKDNRKRRISLVECLEAARIFAYSHQVLQDGIELEEYSDSHLVTRDGAKFHAHVPSRSKHSSRYRINVYNVPMLGNSERFFISRRTETDPHNCRRTQYMNIRFSEDNPEIFEWCAHGAAAYLEIIFQELKKDNKVPQNMSQIAVPTNLTINFYKRLCDSVFKFDTEIRSLNKAEQEILLWELVKEKRYYQTFFGKVSEAVNYNWNFRHI